jgi:hypothetical protein
MWLALGILGFVTLTLSVTLVISTAFLSGWHQACRIWPWRGPVATRRCPSARIMLVRVNWGLSVGVHEEGLAMKLLPPLRPGLDDVFVPWIDVVEVTRDAGLWGPVTRVHIRGWGDHYMPHWVLEDWEKAGSPLGPPLD